MSIGVALSRKQELLAKDMKFGIKVYRIWSLYSLQLSKSEMKVHSKYKVAD
jgi:hypothetical protein